MQCPRSDRGEARMSAPRTYSRHGLNALKARVTVRGLQAIDRRTAAGRALMEWRDELVAALWGDPEVTPQEEALVEGAARTRLFLDHLDSWLLQQPSLILARKRSVVPALRERQALVDSLARLLGQLGLRRRPKRVQTWPRSWPARVGPWLSRRRRRSRGRPPRVTSRRSKRPTPTCAGRRARPRIAT